MTQTHLKSNTEVALLVHYFVEDEHVAHFSVTAMERVRLCSRLVPHTQLTVCVCCVPSQTGMVRQGDSFPVYEMHKFAQDAAVAPLQEQFAKHRPMNPNPPKPRNRFDANQQIRPLMEKQAASSHECGLAVLSLVRELCDGLPLGEITLTRSAYKSMRTLMSAHIDAAFVRVGGRPPKRKRQSLSLQFRLLN